MNWDLSSDLIGEIVDGIDSNRAVKEVIPLMSKLYEQFTNADETSKGYISLLFQNSILQFLDKENLSPTLIEKILIFMKDIFVAKLHIFFDKFTLVTILIQLLIRAREQKFELFEEIGNLALEVCNLSIPDKIQPNEAAYVVSESINYATKSTLIHGLNALILTNSCAHLMGPDVKMILPGISVAMTAVIQTKGTRHKILCEAMSILEFTWSNVKFTEQDAPKIGDLIKRILTVEMQHWKARISRVNLANTLITYQKEIMKQYISPCIRCLFAAVCDESLQVKQAVSPIIEQISGDIIISGEFEQCVIDLTRCAKLSDDLKRLNLLQTISGIILINKDKNNGFEDQILTSLSSLATALIFVSEIEISDKKYCEVDDGFLVHRRPFLSTSLLMNTFETIVINLPADSFVEVLIDILNQSKSSAPEVFYIFGLLKGLADERLIMDILEEPQWWNLKEDDKRSVLALELALEVTSQYCDTDVMQNMLARIIECMASPYPSVEQTAHVALKKIAKDGDIATLLMQNADYLTDRLMARLQFIDIHPEILTVFSAILTVEGDVSNLLSHIIPRIFEILDTKDNLQMPILRMLSRCAEKMPAVCDDIVDRCIHFILSPSLSQQTAALDAICVALPKISDEEKLLPMVHQMWGPSILILNSSVDNQTPAAASAVNIVKTALQVARSFVKQRVGEQLSLFSAVLIGCLRKLEGNIHNESAFAMAKNILDLFACSYDGEVIFVGRELEMFNLLLNCLPKKVNEVIRVMATNVLWNLFNSDKPFLLTLMMEVANKIPVSAKKTTYFKILPKDVVIYIGKLLDPPKPSVVN
ncbi:hypothetical protein TVAG_260060 [Trichomonas vaginalis G3]|uniref:TTI1 C-terminal TPR domain-containing protein n=1 Tax=Trichomonas vaginalis (strain ATCC PRA-98 / G3) TaxID=412133 RepID=A2E8T9_TRIV3|nr:TEL2 interacting protein 1 TTI1 family member family [Trichomonas vaginalis G3]EAY10921.1 hypothetical protein TVAG_260060 [Trichomonas vaginalis G3]KAI5485540.1 TEL2 interacting protein 1 TTI1 family member family [Trichomonas vaginalis G3]|eukprot:XP_001323144.1 hypothetical protein [Trichomonas vaginalis G3]